MLGLCHLQKFSDDSVGVWCFRDGQEKEKRSWSTTLWRCRKNHLLSNVAEIKVTVVDYRRKRTTTSPISIMGQDVKLAHTYSYLGVHLDNKLDWKVNLESV